MEVCRRSSWLLLLLGVSLLATTLQGVQGEAESEGPSESECRPYIEKALKELETGDTKNPDADDSKEDVPTIEITTDDSDHQADDDNDDDNDGDDETREESVEQTEPNVEEKTSDEQDNTQEETDAESEDTEVAEDTPSQEEKEEPTPSKEDSAENVDNQSEEATTKSDKQDSKENNKDLDKDQSQEDSDKKSQEESQETDDDKKSQESLETDDAQKSQDDSLEKDDAQKSQENSQEQDDAPKSKENSQEQDDAQKSQENSQEQDDAQKSQEDLQEKSQEQSDDAQESQEAADSPDNNTDKNTTAEQADSKEDDEITSENVPLPASAEDVEQTQEESSEKQQSSEEQNVEKDQESAEKISGVEEEQTTQENSTENVEESVEKKSAEVQEQTPNSAEDDIKSGEPTQKSNEDAKSSETVENKSDEADDNKSDAADAASSKEQDSSSAEAEASKTIDKRSTDEDNAPTDEAEASESAENETKEDETAVSEQDDDSLAPEEELSLDIDIPTDLRNTDHVEHLLKLDAEASETETIINRAAEITLRELKKLYENAIKPLEVLYKYRDLSNRHFGDSEIFSKPLILFMGPWSGGKSSIINYLLDNEYNETSLKTGAEPSPAYFNLLLHGDEYEVIDGTQLAADFTFSGLQKFGQGLEERLRGVKLPHKLLEKVNIVEIPGILEVRKQVSRVFPFNDACQWFIDRADIIFLVYDPSKLDVGPETEAILDQLKGREHQSRIILNKADQVKPEELMRVQGALIWNISPLMSSPQPPIMYTTSLWSRPYEPWAPTRLLQAQERAFLRDLRTAVDKRIENKIASARRFAVRVRNHAKMVDCYLTTYYNHKSVFGNRKQVADEIIDHPQDYHIYEGLSTLTNISRYDLPDPDVYRDFFKLNPLYEFQQLSATCTYFRGCPINRLDIAIAYDLPELVGKHKRLVERALAEANQAPVPAS